MGSPPLKWVCNFIDNENNTDHTFVDIGTFTITNSEDKQLKKKKRPEWLSIAIWEFKNRKWKDNRQKRKARDRFKTWLKRNE